MKPSVPLSPATAREAGKLTRQIQSGLASGLERGFGRVPEERIQQAMRTPLRRVVLEALFWGLPRALNDTRAGEVVTSVRCHITGRTDGYFDVYWLAFAEGTWTASRGSAGHEPELTITVDAAELLLIAVRRSSPWQAYLGGRLRASGNPIVAARLATLFRAPGA